MKRNRELRYLLSVRGIIAVILTAAICFAAFRFGTNTHAQYEKIVTSDAKVIKTIEDSQLDSEDEVLLSYRELSDDYKSLNPTCVEWTDFVLPEPEDQEELEEGATPKPTEEPTAEPTLGPDGEPVPTPEPPPEKGGLYFISEENLEFCIYDADSAALCGGDYTLGNFDYMWLNSENDNFYTVVNLAGETVDLSGYYILARESSGLYASRVIINCYEAKEVNLTDAILLGTLLAPDAVVTVDGAYVFGEVQADEMKGKAITYKEIKFTGYNVIMNSLRTADFSNDAVRRACVQYLINNDTFGTYEDYTEDTLLKRKDLEAVKEIVIEDAEFETGIDSDLLKLTSLEKVTVRRTNLKTVSTEGLTFLQSIVIDDCPEFTGIHLAPAEVTDVELTNLPLLTEIDLSGLPLLLRLRLENTGVTGLDLTSNGDLRILSYAGTKIGWLKEQNLERLTYLNCSDSDIQEEILTGEEYPALVTLIVSSNPNVKEIQPNTFKKMTQLDACACGIENFTVNGKTILTYIRLSDNLIEKLDLTPITHVFSVECYGESLKEIKVTRFAEVANASISVTKVKE